MDELARIGHAIWLSWCDNWERLLRVLCGAVLFVLIATRPIPCNELKSIARNPVKEILGGSPPKDTNDKKSETSNE